MLFIILDNNNICISYLYNSMVFILCLYWSVSPVSVCLDCVKTTMLGTQKSSPCMPSASEQTNNLPWANIAYLLQRHPIQISPKLQTHNKQTNEKKRTLKCVTYLSLMEGLNVMPNVFGSGGGGASCLCQMLMEFLPASRVIYPFPDGFPHFISSWFGHEPPWATSKLPT